MERKITLLLALGFFTALSIDMLSKLWVERALTPGQPVPILGEVFQLTLGYNTGVTFGMFANSGNLTLVITGIVIIGLGWWFIKALRAGDLPRTSALALGLILGGAVGNFADRFADGRVTDFLDAGIGTLRWPTFNLADVFIVTGIALLAMLVLMHPHATTRDSVQEIG